MKKQVKRIKKINKLSNHTPALLFAVIFAVIGAFVLVITKAADLGTINLSPTQATVTTGSTVDVTVKINSGTTLVTSVGADIKFEPSMLQFVSIDTSMSPFDTKLEAEVDPNDPSLIRITQGEISSPASGIQTIAKITFQAKGAGTTNVTVNPTSHVWQNSSNAQPDILDIDNSTGTKLTLNDTTAPNPPGSLAASNTTISGTKLTWTAPTDNIGVTGYAIFQDNTQIATTATNSYTVGSLTAGKSYSFKVRAFDQAGNNSTFSNVITVTTPTDSEVPTTPTNLTATASITSMALSWTASTDNDKVDHYDVYNGNTVVGHPASNNYTVMGLQPGTAYTFKVVAVDNAGNPSSPATISKSTVTDSTAPSAPGSLSISNQTNVSLTLNWTPSTDNIAVSRYDVYRDGNLVDATSGTSYPFADLKPGTTYTFKVVAVDTSNNTATSSNKSVTLGFKQADINLDNDIDGDDFVVLATNFRKSGPSINRALGNLNYPDDDVIDSADFNILVSNWGK